MLGETEPEDPKHPREDHECRHTVYNDRHRSPLREDPITRVMREIEEYDTNGKGSSTHPNPNKGEIIFSGYHCDRDPIQTMA